MKTKWILAMLVLGMVGLGPAHAKTVIWVSDAHDTDTAVAGPDDQGWIDFLTSLGLTVNYPKPASGVIGYYQTLDATKLAELNAADLIILSRDCGSSQYSTTPTDEWIQWCGITKPIMLFGPYLARSGNARWFNNNSQTARSAYYSLRATVPSDPLFANVLLSATNDVVFYDASVWPNYCSFTATTSAGNGRILAARPDNGNVMIAEWDAGMTFYTASPALPPLGGPRMYFNAGTQESDSAKPPTSTGWGKFNLTPAGEQIFVNALERYLGPVTYNSTPQVNAGKDQSVKLVGGTATAQLSATAADDGDPYGTLLYDWTMVSGPVAVTIVDHETANASVQFTERGVYEFKVTVHDYDPNVPAQSGKMASDNVRVRVKDTAIDDVELGHWTFDEGTGTTANDSAGVNDAGLFGATAGSADPNWAGGWVGSNALQFYGTSFVQIPDPNFGQLRWEITTAAWVKVNAWPGDWSSIIGKWNTTWRFARRQNTNDFTLHLSGVEESLAGSSNINDGYWHHVAATYDGNRVTTYLDGQVNSFMDASGPINEDLDPTHFVMIGNRGDNQTGRGWNGLLDDVRLYSYAISAEDILNLAKLGQNAIPRINAGPDQTLLMTTTDSLMIDAVGTDINGDTLNYQWTVAGPEGGVEFIPSANVEKPTVKFLKQGVYTFHVTVNDGTAGLDGGIFDEMMVTATSPTCQQVISEYGLTLLTDLNKDCRVDLADFAMIAADWVRCYDPQQAGCENPFKWE